MGDEIKWLLKERGGRISESCDIFLNNTPTSRKKGRGKERTGGEVKKMKKSIPYSQRRSDAIT